MPKRRWVRPALLTVCVLLTLAAALVLFAWLRPFTIITAVIHCQLWRDGIRSHSTQVTTSQGAFRVHSYEGGQGQPILLVHGFGSSSESWVGVIGPLCRAGFHVYALDLAGSSNSDAPDVDYSIPLQAEVVRSFLQARHLPQVDLAGVSMGGWVALHFALQHPQAVHRLVLIDAPGAGFQPQFEPALFLPRTPDQLQTLMDRLAPRPTPVPLFLRRDLLRHFASRGWVLRRAIESMFYRPQLLDAQLSHLHTPTLIFWGREDHLIPLSTAAYLHAHIAASELAIIDGCGHTVLESCSARLTPKLLAFLR